ncbi:Aminoglycoside phosphotransferase [Candidatus Magnetomorum sp. HK-1]|nr:Aminoglycoside phosphotransferase [Candidatus Magnetomorum sp. HK-1]
MQAIILAAGLGTRLRPHTNICPKPLFSIDGQPIIHRTILTLIAAGCDDILINTHHLAEKIQEFIHNQKYSVPIRLYYEPEILGTGGGIKNLLSHVQSFPVLIVNSDIVTDLDFKNLFETHKSHQYPVTLIMHDEPQFNTVRIEKHAICDFRSGHDSDINIKAFTGIHIIDSLVGDYIPENVFYSITKAYENMIKDGHCIYAHEVKNHYWIDIGTPAGYAKASARFMAQTAFQRIWPNISLSGMTTEKLKGDGSDRSWWRYENHDKSLIMANHGISRVRLPGLSFEKKEPLCTEVESFVRIGNHLHDIGIPVPKIIHYDFFSGLVFVEDLGNVHFQDYIINMKHDLDRVRLAYESVIDILINMSTKGVHDLDNTFTFQTSHYDANMILSFECQYFVNAFVRDYAGLNISYTELEKEFTDLSHAAMEHVQWGLMHRDFQSRNIMFTKNQFYIIDFQGARFGPIQYDLASLLIDPYVPLPDDLQDHLLRYSLKKYKLVDTDVNSQRFNQTYRYCRLFRNLQMLGAFAFLSQKKGKTSFEQYIPLALSRLYKQIKNWSLLPCPGLTNCVEQLNVKINKEV